MWVYVTFCGCEGGVGRNFEEFEVLKTSATLTSMFMSVNSKNLL